MCKRNSPDKNKGSKGCARETPQIKKRRRKIKEKKKRRRKKANTGCVRETPLRKVNPTWDV